MIQLPEVGSSTRRTSSTTSARDPRLPADELHGGQPDEVPVDPGDGTAEEEPEEAEEGDINPEEESKENKEKDPK